MKKEVLRVDNEGVADLLGLLEVIVCPAISNIIAKLDELEIRTELKPILISIFKGNYTPVEELYKERLNVDAKVFVTKSARTEITKQAEEVLKDFRDYAKSILSAMYGSAGRISATSPKVFDFLELNEDREPVITEENRNAITEHFTMYLTTAQGKELRTLHNKYVEATVSLFEFCRNHNIQAIIPSCTTFYEFDVVSRELKARQLNYDEMIAGQQDKSNGNNLDDDIGPTIIKPTEKKPVTTVNKGRAKPRTVASY